MRSEKTSVEPKIIEKGQILLLGFGFFGNPFQASEDWTGGNEISRLWNRFATYMAGHGHRIKHVENEMVFCELCVENERTVSIPSDHFEVFIGVHVGKLEDVPVEMSAKVLPPAVYAVFTFEREPSLSDWQRAIYGEWMPGSGYRQAHRYSLQLRDRRAGMPKRLGGSGSDIYVPVKTSATAGEAKETEESSG